MKLRDIYIICKGSYCYINNHVEEYNKINSGEVLSDGLQPLLNIEFLHDEVDELINRKFPSSIDMQGNIIHDYSGKHLVTRLINKLECIIQLCEAMGMNTEETLGLDVKLPECSSLTDLKKNIGELEFIFTKCPFFQNEKESLEFRSIDIGSVWLAFSVVGVSLGGSIILNNIAAFVDKCFIINSHRLSCKKQKMEIEKAQEDEEKKQELLGHVEDLYKVLVDNAIRELEQSAGYKIQDGDEKGRVEQSIDKMIKLMDKGLQIYSTIDSPKETKALFEPIEMKYLSLKDGLELIEKDKKPE